MANSFLVIHKGLKRLLAKTKDALNRWAGAEKYRSQWVIGREGFSASQQYHEGS